MRQVEGAWALGIDPGMRGAVAVINPGGLATIWDADGSPGRAVCQAVWSIYGEDNWVAIIEQVHAMPGQGVTGVFSFGKAYGEALGALCALGVTEPNFVSPQRWKKYFGLGREKYASLELARELFTCATEAGLLKLKKHHDRAEALLIAEYGRRMVTRGSE
jgi:crossover junction endodeoxyribonuclease RuvC